MACRLASMLKQREMRNKQQIEENKVFFRIFAAETIITSNPQAISMAISIAVKSLNTMHHDSMSVNFVRFLHTFPFPHNAT